MGGDGPVTPLRALVGLVSGLVVSVAIAVSVGMSASDAGALIAMSFGTGLACLAVGSAAMVALRRRARPAYGVRAVVVALIPVVALASGALVAARAMFVSTHDLSVVAVVMAGAGTAGVLGALLLAAELDRSRRRADEATERQEAMERSRRELVAWVSHDLRTPLAGIRVMAEALADDVVADTETVARYHQNIQTEAERLARLVDDLFELSRIQVEGVRLVGEPASLSELVSDAIASAAPVARAKGVRLEGRVEDPAPVVELSSPEMLRAVRNLLENAIRHTPAGGRVSVEVGRGEGVAVVSVSDECGGIPETDIGRVFDLAYRGDDARSPDERSGGLGLTIAKGLVEAHRGEIAVHNVHAGCRFSLRLPLAAGS
jgi:signal transduction histidine kinase